MPAESCSRLRDRGGRLCRRCGLRRPRCGAGRAQRSRLEPPRVRQPRRSQWICDRRTAARRCFRYTSIGIQISTPPIPVFGLNSGP
jgi:hypothetical protein